MGGKRLAADPKGRPLNDPFFHQLVIAMYAAADQVFVVVEPAPGAGADSEIFRNHRHHHGVDDVELKAGKIAVRRVGIPILANLPEEFVEPACGEIRRRLPQDFCVCAGQAGVDLLFRNLAFE